MRKLTTIVQNNIKQKKSRNLPPRSCDTMMACSPLENTRLDEKCRRILQEDEIRFAGLINYKFLINYLVR
ncbi:MAG TPA: hypothetical protein VJZ17_00160 [Nitrosopumilaceae archaeon]|nr:hypothetical protein [Nitrosopumilaceae archaeon]